MSKKRGCANHLVRYIDEQLKSGFSEDVIRRHLANYGHSADSIDRSFKAVKKRHFSFLSKFMVVFCVSLSLFILLWSALSTTASMLRVFLGFLPTVFVLIISIILIEKPKHRNLNVILYLPLIFALLFLLVGRLSSLFAGMDVNRLAGINFLISFSFVIILYLTGSLRTEAIEVIPEHRLAKKEIFAVPDEDDLEKYLRSVEDKCKAINFAIGRVYTNKKGGSDKLRDKIKIDKAWYNEISDAISAGNGENKSKIIKNIDKIKERLELLQHSEKEVFGSLYSGLKNIEHADDGSDKILHVLIKNDKDPVKSYVDGAVEFCEKVRKGL